jgi:hypothetical protein
MIGGDGMFELKLEFHIYPGGTRFLSGEIMGWHFGAGQDCCPVELEQEVDEDWKLCSPIPVKEQKRLKRLLERIVKFLQEVGKGREIHWHGEDYVEVKKDEGYDVIYLYDGEMDFLNKVKAEVRAILERIPIMAEVEEI